MYNVRFEPQEGSTETDGGCYDFDCGQHIELRRRNQVEGTNDSVSYIQGCHNSRSCGLMLFLFMNCLQNATLAPLKYRLFLALFVFLISCNTVYR